MTVPVKAILSHLQSQGKMGPIRSETYKDYVLNCPFKENHKRGDQTPSFGINKDNGKWHCLSCGSGGNSIAYLSRQLLGVLPDLSIYHNLDNVSVSPDDLMATLEGLSTPAVIPHLNYQWPETIDIGQSPEALDYIASRNIPIQVWENAGLTYCAGDRIVSVPNKNGITTSVEGFSIIIPISYKGNSVGFTARTIRDRKPKYFTPITPISSVFYDPQGVMSVADDIVLVEGPMDALACWREGLPGVSMLGSNLSESRAKQLFKFRRVFFWFDNDDAGDTGLRKAVDKWGEMLNWCKIDMMAYMKDRDLDEALHKDPCALPPGFGDEVRNQMAAFKTTKRDVMELLDLSLGGLDA